MNMESLIAQMKNASNPMAMITNILNPSQNQQVKQFQSKSEYEKAEEIAKICNEKGISKEQFQKIINLFGK